MRAAAAALAAAAAASVASMALFLLPACAYQQLCFGARASGAARAGTGAR